ncbi:HD-GYP domain-containing protein [Pseudoalteromonas sp. MMG005]|uniref:HD-GYP domain-containing protein n=1 Tax=Pseudoalteromonas sp. MMG005 TaxID=2822682 RepID=UPI001B39D0BF|nr:HD-GYP domain-containing protein [Pseudoalteromonas sp. MMG005]MBQ4847396.1 HD-GYP domain-containing protein [Pseudoalteromonas sp. MMG005]
MKIINIKDLKPGMYVAGVIKQTGHIKIKSQGWVKTQKSIDKLVSTGVLEVEIDPDKTIQNEQQQAAPPIAESIPETEFNPWHKSASIESELTQATKLYDEAKTLQQKAFVDLQSGGPINISAFKETAHGLIDSVFRNQDALACIARIREKDTYLLEHSINVSILISIFAKHMGIERPIIEQMATGALLHDIGKVHIPDTILQKPSQLTKDEFEVMKSHAKYSFDIVLQAQLGKIATEIAGYHHERLDGSGYPYGYKADELSQYVKMAAIVDVYDALTAERIYKVGMTPVKAFKILKEGTPHHYDTELLNIFINAIGVYPVGTLVKLTSQRVGIVCASNPEAPLKPTVKVFYHAKHMHYVEVKDIDLSNKRVDDSLEAAIKPEEFNLDLLKFFRHSMLP